MKKSILLVGALGILFLASCSNNSIKTTSYSKETTSEIIDYIDTTNNNPSEISSKTSSDDEETSSSTTTEEIKWGKPENF